MRSNGQWDLRGIFERRIAWCFVMFKHRPQSNTAFSTSMIWCYFIKKLSPWKWESDLPWHCCYKSTCALIFPAFLFGFLVLPTHCGLITRPVQSVSCMAGLCLPITHSLSLPGWLGIHTHAHLQTGDPSKVFFFAVLNWHALFQQQL